jgi:hypothetical protein
VALAALALALGRALLLARARTAGHLVYVLDDPYIHMAMAKNLAAHGVWGVTRQAFTAASSSPLWTLMLAALFRLLGVREWIPFALDALFAAAVLWLADRELERRRLGPLARLAWLLAIVLATPMPALVFCGLEHLPHLLVLLAFTFALARELDAPAADAGVALPLLAAALTAIRYEGLFTVAIAALLLLATGRVRRVLATLAAAAVPPLAFGLYSLAHGGALLPNSILLKGHAPHAGTARALRDALGGHAAHELLGNPHLLVLAIVLALAWALHRVLSRPGLRGADVPPALVLGTLVLHLQLAQTGWFFRYEAYLVAAALVAIAGLAPALREHLAARGVARPGVWLAAAGVIGAAVLAQPLLHRAKASWSRIPVASMNIWQQQIQMGRFARAHLAGEAVALDDIGAVTFLADIRCLDLVGLANLEVLRMRDAGHYDSHAIAALAEREGVRTAIVYDQWFESFIPGGVPAGWTKVGLWRFPDVIVTYSDSVSFYATRPEAVAPLTASLRAYAPLLPRAVRQSGAYTRPR